MASRLLTAVLAGAVVTTGAAGCTAEVDADPASAAQGWRQLPDPPLSPRVSATLVGVDDQLLVVGGWDFLCPPNADCVAPPGPLYADGAVYDRTTDSWRGITPAPFGLAGGATAARDGTAYLLTTCETGPRCDAQPRLLAYDLADDRWTDHGPVPEPRTHGRNLTVVDRTLLVSTVGEGLAEVPDLFFDPDDGTWTELPDDPLAGDDHDRFVAHVGDSLVLAGSSVAAPGATRMAAKVAARFDLTTQQWTELPDAPGGGYQLLPTDRGPLLNEHFGDSSGWLLDPETWTWSPLPALPRGHQDIGGVLDHDRAVYGTDLTSGAAVYDSAADAFVVIPPPPGRDDAYDESLTALGRDLVVFGGQRWTGEDGELLDDAWLWTAPSD